MGFWLVLTSCRQQPDLGRLRQANEGCRGEGNRSNWVRSVFGPRLRVAFSVPGEILASWLKSIDGAYLKKLREALFAFPRRPYWTRLWIFQEIAAGALTQVLCGDDIFSWRDVDLLLQLCGEGRRKYLSSPGRDHPELFPGAWQMGQMKRVHPLHSTDLGRAIFATRHSQCSDVRDHIYGILSLVRWSGDPIVPDYNESIFDLAMEAILHIEEFTEVRDLLHVLEIHHSPSQIKERLLQPPTAVDTGECRGVSIGDQCRRFNTQEAIDLDGNVLADGRDHLTITAERDDATEDEWEETGRKYPALAEAWARACRKWRVEGRREMPVFLQARNQVDKVALACSAARTGDIVVPISSDLRGDHFLIIRRNRTCDAYDVVGQGFFLPGYRARMAEIEGGDATVYFSLTAADAMQLVGQDFVSSTEYDADARIQRLVTNPIVDQPVGAVRLDTGP